MGENQKRANAEVVDIDARTGASASGSSRTFDQIEGELLEKLENLTAVINHVRRELKDSPYDQDLRKQLKKDRAILRILTQKLLSLRQTSFEF